MICAGLLFNLTNYRFSIPPSLVLGLVPRLHSSLALLLMIGGNLCGGEGCRFVRVRVRYNTAAYAVNSTHSLARYDGLEARQTLKPQNEDLRLMLNCIHLIMHKSFVSTQYYDRRCMFHLSYRYWTLTSLYENTKIDFLNNESQTLITFVYCCRYIGVCFLQGMNIYAIVYLHRCIFQSFLRCH
jgi:hypothetical protein